MALKRRRPRDPEGRMTLSEHFREFRRRLFIAAATVAVASVVAGIYYDQVFAFLSEPFYRYARANPQNEISLNFGEATSALSNLISLSIFVGVVVSSPVWLYQIWAFVVPGLTRKEKRISLAFLGATIPLFLLGCGLAYAILPQSLQILYGLSPAGTSNIQQTSMYFAFVTRFILVFGIGFLFPVVLVGLNAIGLMPASRLIKGWRVSVVLIFVFAAVATPTADPFTMFVFALPLTALYFGAWFVCRVIDRRKEANRPEWLDVDDTEASEL
ncbi:twin-arginine translocase subunit TatC [Phycicoccus duodecadis]|uniref:Sec-independent protein translocase protein TatC n=1 Tax=Phycicoccus duodecadis TaxID=173053 RepID=A0A2N3YES9_9MICO|nr:twin-arginine translocase subunit TatC [Phycicoccus duodecadis]PKW25343.1 sec-independent protein translocase protein TatC [Phycicoccus duodecadis]